MFHQILSLADIQAPKGFYERLWTAPLTLWYLMWQCLKGATLEAVLTDARRGGADSLCAKGKRLSTGLRSKATTSFSDARQRLSVDWVSQCFLQMGRALLSLYRQMVPTSDDLSVELLDGSTKRLRPYGDIPKHFPPHRNGHKKRYWCIARVVVSFCAVTGIATGALIASLHLSEQALAVQLILQAAKTVLYVGDRNFGIWRVARAALQSGGHALVRLTEVRARRLYGQKRLPGFLDMTRSWEPTRQDQVDKGLRKEPVPGRLIIVRTHRRGHRPFRLYLFTTLTDVQAYPPQRLLELYGLRWQVELNYRHLKTTMDMEQSELKSADMVRKEFYAGLMAYDLVRGLMATAAAQAGCQPIELSFSKVLGLLASILTEAFMTGISGPYREKRLLWMMTEAAAARLPRRRKPRPNEPRAQYYEPQIFPKMKGSRAKARRALKKASSKS